MSNMNTTAAMGIFLNFGLKRMNLELAERNLPAQKGKEVAATLLVAGVRSQGEFSALVINLSEGNLEADVLKEHLVAAFPDAKISDRHGAHYLCHARTGNLKGCRFRPPTANERKRAIKGKSRPKDIEDMTTDEIEKILAKKLAEEAEAKAAAAK